MYLAIRLADMAKMCEGLAHECTVDGRGSMSKRFKAAGKCFSGMLTELTEDARQYSLLGGDGDADKGKLV